MARTSSECPFQSACPVIRVCDHYEPREFILDRILLAVLAPNAESPLQAPVEHVMVYANIVSLKLGLSLARFPGLLFGLSAPIEVVRRVSREQCPSETAVGVENR